MRGKDIPLQTVIISGNGNIRTRKEPLYELRTAKEEKEYQDKLGDSKSFWYGTWCNKCCGVYPKFFTELSFESNGYYVCLVCGKEGKHRSMNWEARDSWNNGEYAWEPTDRQMTIFDFM